MRGYPANADLYACLAVGAIVFSRLLFLIPFTLNPESSVELFSAMQVLDGKTAYKDFYWIYGWFFLYLDRALFRVFGLEMIYIRYGVLIAATLASCVSYLVARSLLPPVSAFFVALFAFAFFVGNFHMSGHMYSILGATAFLGFLLLYCRSENAGWLAVSALAGGFVFINQPGEVGLSTLMGGAAFLFLWAGLNQNRWAPVFIFFIAAFFLDALSYAYFAYQASPQSLIPQIFPQLSGTEMSPARYFSRPIPEILPFQILNARFAGGMKTALNQYLVKDFKFWIVIFSLFVAAGWLGKNWRDRNSISDYPRVLLFFIFAGLLPAKFLVTLAATNPQYLFLLPNFILLAYFLRKVATSHLKKGLGLAVAVLFLFYFVYPVWAYGKLYRSQGVPLDLKYSKDIIVTPYERDFYHRALSYINDSISPGQPIVIASELNSFLYIFSGRQNIFAENYVAFQKTSFAMSRQGMATLPKAMADDLENKLIERIERENVRLLFLPVGYLTESNLARSPFLRYVSKNWKKIREFGDAGKMTAVDSLLNLFLFERL